MKTEHLIDSLVADQGHRPLGSRRGLCYALPVAIAGALVIFAYFLDMRADLTTALTSWRYLLKLAMAGLIAGAAISLMLHLARPQNGTGAAFRWLPLLVLPLLAGFCLEGMLVPRSQWLIVAMGKNPIYCLIFVPLLSLAPLAATLWILGRGAPQSPAAAGAVAGLASGGIGALIYALHCKDDSPFYLAIWYLGAIALVAGLGTVIGRRYLRW